MLEPGAGAASTGAHAASTSWRKAAHHRGSLERGVPKSIRHPKILQLQVHQKSWSSCAVSAHLAGQVGSNELDSLPSCAACSSFCPLLASSCRTEADHWQTASLAASLASRLSSALAAPEPLPAPLGEARLRKVSPLGISQSEDVHGLVRSGLAECLAARQPPARM